MRCTTLQWTTAMPPHFTSPGWSVSQGYTNLNYDGSHHLSDSACAVVSFSFTGVATYLFAPLWAYQVADYASIDFLPSILVDLEDYGLPNEGGGPEVISAQANTISFVPGRQYVAVDTFIYHCSRRGGPTPATPTASAAAAATTTRAHSLSKTAQIIIGATAGGVLLFTALGAVLYLRRRSKRLGQRSDSGNTGTRSTMSTGHAGSVTVPTKPWPATWPSEPSLT
ncbi:hypothetical protein DFH09DRAFT_1274946 [Mycena vulgaris]|nr:hypothetical protein DFH09DRAFT_1274946 [Mycena vulgaris]